MNDETCERLEAINRRFYARVATEFSDTRNHAWPGWTRVLDHMVAGKSIRVLDVGCGNGRFALALQARLGEGSSYCGLDASQAMLSHAARQLDEHAGEMERALLCHEIGDAASLAAIPAGPFDCIAVFGLLHHVPSHARRRSLLQALTQRLAPGGLLAVTAWRFATSARFSNRIAPWSRYNETAPEPVDERQLEPGDHLMTFGDPGVAEPAIRYCHHADDEEIDRMLEGLPVSCIDRFDADGRSGDLNHYRVLRRHPVA